MALLFSCPVKCTNAVTGQFSSLAMDNISFELKSSLERQIEVGFPVKGVAVNVSMR